VTDTPSNRQGESTLRRVRRHLVAFAAVSLALVMGLAVLWESAGAPDGQLRPDSLV
jgi:hypothetical protein